jgi:hypothetical protein
MVLSLGQACHLREATGGMKPHLSHQYNTSDSLVINSWQQLVESQTREKIHIEAKT